MIQQSIMNGRHVNKKMDYMKLALCIALPLAVGFVSAIISAEPTMEYSTMTKPALSPPAAVFPVAWTILYILMGVAAYIVHTAHVDAASKIIALKFYYIQLIGNFMWSIFFFNAKEYLFAFAWLTAIWILVFCMMAAYRRVSWAAVYLTIPYFAWLTFAGYLNLGVYVLNR